MNNNLILDKNSFTSTQYITEVEKKLKNYGVVICRNLFDQCLLLDLEKEWKKQFKYPAISGTIGFAQTSYSKKTLSAFMLGKSALEIATNNLLIDCIEGYMKSPCTLAEANAVFDKSTSYEYFGLHADFSVGWKKTHSMKKSLSKSDMKFPIGVGAIFYLHDTEHGAFKYSLTSHKIQAKFGQKIKNYPQNLKSEIINNIFVCRGKAGDLILFDDRGFHGPDQPSADNRRVLILDYYRDNTFGSTVVEPHKVKVTDLANLSKKQYKVLGFYAKNLVSPDDYVYARFKKNKLFKLIAWIIEKSFIAEHIKNLFKSKIGF